MDAESIAKALDVTYNGQLMDSPIHIFTDPVTGSTFGGTLDLEDCRRILQEMRAKGTFPKPNWDAATVFKEKEEQLLTEVLNHLPIKARPKINVVLQPSGTWPEDALPKGTWDIKTDTLTLEYNEDTPPALVEVAFMHELGHAIRRHVKKDPETPEYVQQEYEAWDEAAPLLESVGMGKSYRAWSARMKKAGMWPSTMAPATTKQYNLRATGMPKDVEELLWRMAYPTKQETAEHAPFYLYFADTPRMPTWLAPRDASDPKWKDLLPLLQRKFSTLAPATEPDELQAIKDRMGKHAEAKRLQLVQIDAAKFDALWAKRDGYYIGPGGTGATIADRYNDVKKYLQTGRPIQSSWVGIYVLDGVLRVGFQDGRHRYAVLRDSGMKGIPMSMDTESKRNAEKYGLIYKGLAPKVIPIERYLGDKCPPVNFADMVAKFQKDGFPDLDKYESPVVCKDQIVLNGEPCTLTEKYTPPGYGDWGRIDGAIEIGVDEFENSSGHAAYWISYPGGRSRPTCHIAAVLSDVQREGYGRWLVAQIEHRARQYNVTVIDLMDHEESGEFWPTMGYHGKGPTKYKRHKDLEPTKENMNTKHIPDNAVLRTDPSLDGLVRHMGYEPVDSGPTMTDTQLLADSQRRLHEAVVVSDFELNPHQKAHLKLARKICDKVSDQLGSNWLRGIHAARIPAASDRVRTAGVYNRDKKEIIIDLQQLESGRATIDTTIHELGHHASGAEDATPEHKAMIDKVAADVVREAMKGDYDSIIKA